LGRHETPKDGTRWDREYAYFVARTKVAPALDPVVSRFAYVGSMRRRAPTVGDVDILVIPRRSDSEVVQAFSSVCMGHKPESGGFDRLIGMVEGEPGDFISFNVFITTPESWGAALHYTTGSWEYNVAVRGVAKNRGLHADQEGVHKRRKDGRAGALLPGSGMTEAAYCAAIGIPWLEPHRRIKDPFGRPPPSKFCSVCERAFVEGDRVVNDSAGKRAHETCFMGATPGAQETPDRGEDEVAE
jgi:DNA polymerase/3'-5' exonuclease PolX